MGTGRKVEPPRQLALGVVTDAAYRRKLAQQAEYRKKKKKREKKRPQQTDMALKALLGNQGVTDGVEKVHTLKEASKFEEFYPGTSVTSVNLLDIVQEVFETYGLAVGDPRKDIDAILGHKPTVGDLRKVKVPNIRNKSKTLFADDRANLTAEALLLLLSWVQRTRKEMATILVEPVSEGNRTGTSKSERLTKLLERFILGPRADGVSD